MKTITNPAVKAKFETYPEEVQVKMLFLRRLMYEVENETEGVTDFEETLKWNEPSYLTKQGSTVRMDWKPKFPDQYCVYFNCQTNLVETFKAIYSDVFSFDGTRAIVLQMQDEIPISALKHCVSLAFVYHKVKSLPLLGA